MELGEVIRKHRKMKELTQEEMARYLGVTAPAVNKWENGNAMPDITLLLPIARLLDVSLDELLSFRKELTTEEIRELVQEAEQKFSELSYDDAFRWTKKQIELYPNCEALIYSLAMEMEGQCLMQEIRENEEYTAFVLNCCERLLKSKDEVMQTAAADFLYGYYLRKEQYEKAEGYLAFFSTQNPERKRKQAVLYEKAGNLQKACQTYEEILWADYQILFSVLNSLFIMKLHENDLEKARYYAEKKKALARLFEMGEYSIYAADLELVQIEKNPDQTIACIQGIMNNLDTMYAFSSAPLYSHMTFKKADSEFIETIRKKIMEDFRSDENFGYMKDDPRWAELLSECN